MAAFPKRYPLGRDILPRDGPERRGPSPGPLSSTDDVLAHSASGTDSVSWKSELAPSEVLQRNFYFCTIDDPSVIELRHRIGIDHVMMESDYPHADSTWPDTQEVIDRTVGHLPDDELAMIAHGNAARLFRHPLPPATCHLPPIGDCSHIE